MLGDLLAEGHIDKRERLEIVGALLYRLLFNDEMDKEFLKAKENARTSKTALRVVLEFERDTDHLALLPWEYLYRPGSDGAGFFVAAQEYLVLSRYVAVNKKWAAWQGDETVRILVVISRPRNREIVDPGKAITFLGSVKDNSDGKVIIETLEQPTKKSFEEALRAEPHIVHFIGHGRYSNERGSVAFVGPDGKAVDVTEEDFATCFQDRETRLVFLEVCEGAASDSYTAFSGTALRLAYHRVPAVIAMRYEISNEAANAFSLRFYRELYERRPIDKAVQAARCELSKYLNDEEFSSREFGCPVLFLLTEEDMDTKGVIPFPVARPAGDTEEEHQQEEPTPDPTKAYYCPKPRCNAELNIRARRCFNCGSEWRLHSCGEPYLIGAKYCFCGERISGVATAAVAPAAASASALVSESKRQSSKFLGEEKSPWWKN
jgi:hypothetical protein